VWETTLDGRKLTFHLSGINNQNFLMTDEETGSWWQQVSGKAILGPLKGRRLKRIRNDDVTYALWRREHPEGRILRPDPAFAGDYAPADWESEIAKLPVVTSAGPREPLPPRATILGLAVGEEARAYPRERVLKEGPINDRLGDRAILLAAAEDGKSIRAFGREVKRRNLEFFAAAGDGPWRLIDSGTGSRWDFSGLAVEGPLAGERLAPIQLLTDYWFDWKTYHPGTGVYAAGLPSR
jgi:hypothetical protein